MDAWMGMGGMEMPRSYKGMEVYLSRSYLGSLALQPPRVASRQVDGQVAGTLFVFLFLVSDFFFFLSYRL